MIVTRLVIIERVRLTAQVCGDIVHITSVTVPSRLKECSWKKFAIFPRVCRRISLIICFTIDNPECFLDCLGL